MTREIQYKPVKVSVQGVEVNCANLEIAQELLEGVRQRGLSTIDAEIYNKTYAFSGGEALKAFLSVYNGIKNR